LRAWDGESQTASLRPRLGEDPIFEDSYAMVLADASVSDVRDVFALIPALVLSRRSSPDVFVLPSPAASDRLRDDWVELEQGEGGFAVMGYEVVAGPCVEPHSVVAYADHAGLGVVVHGVSHALNAPLLVSSAHSTYSLTAEH